MAVPGPTLEEVQLGATAAGRTVRAHERVRRSVDKCISLAEDASACEARADSISGWSVANHLEHLLLADRWILGWIESVVRGAVDGESSDPGGRPSALGYMVLSTGFIPRGRGRAPDPSRPTGLSATEIATGFRAIREQVDALEPRLAELDASKGTLEHPVLGRFTPARWLRFAEVHHAHHDKIIRDILAAEGD